MTDWFFDRWADHPVLFNILFPAAWLTVGLVLTRILGWWIIGPPGENEQVIVGIMVILWPLWLIIAPLHALGNILI